MSVDLLANPSEISTDGVPEREPLRPREFNSERIASCWVERYLWVFLIITTENAHARRVAHNYRYNDNERYIFLSAPSEEDFSPITRVKPDVPEPLLRDQ